jgi:hypothetical protein
MRISRGRDVVGSDLYKYCQVFGSEYRRGLDWWIGFTHHLHELLGTTSNYSAITDLHASQITTHCPFPAWYVSNSRSLATASNSGDTSVSTTDVVTVRRISRNWTHSAGLSAINWTGCPSSLFYKHFARAESKTPFFYCCVRVRGKVFTEPLLTNSRLFIRLLHSNGCTSCLFRGLCLATGLYAKTPSSLSLPLCVLCIEYLKWTPGGDVMPIRPYVSFARLTRKLAKAVMLPNCIQKMTGSNIGWDTDYTDWVFVVVVDFPSSTRKFPGEYINLLNGRFLSLYFQFIIQCRPKTPCCTVWDSDNVDKI